MSACGCVFRSVARISINELHRLRREGPHWHFKRFSRDAEYAAELALVAKHELDEQERIILREYFIAGRDWRMVERMTNLGRGQFFHAAYRAQVKFGRAIVARGLFPPHAYFAGVHFQRRECNGASIAYQVYLPEAA
jgi:hypothetical protein